MIRKMRIKDNGRGGDEDWTRKKKKGRGGEDGG